ncbi:hypothetical protein H8356DRAFT_1337274 [Neocallimastix lanati (nom. inval.)]|nr:hypothetical protein H8356DRAFT_1337274 [Neocallimastix sp. JGI-2020a]
MWKLKPHGNIKVVTTHWCAFVQVDIVPTGQPYCLFNFLARFFSEYFFGSSPNYNKEENSLVSILMTFTSATLSGSLLGQYLVYITPEFKNIILKPFVQEKPDNGALCMIVRGLTTRIEPDGSSTNHSRNMENNKRNKSTENKRKKKRYNKFNIIALYLYYINEMNLPNVLNRKKIPYLKYLKDLRQKKRSNQVISNTSSVIKSKILNDKYKKKTNKEKKYYRLSFELVHMNTISSPYNFPYGNKYFLTILDDYIRYKRSLILIALENFLIHNKMEELNDSKEQLKDEKLSLPFEELYKKMVNYERITNRFNPYNNYQNNLNFSFQNPPVYLLEDLHENTTKTTGKHILQKSSIPLSIKSKYINKQLPPDLTKLDEIPDKSKYYKAVRNENFMIFKNSKFNNLPITSPFQAKLLMKYNEDIYLKCFYTTSFSILKKEQATYEMLFEEKKVLIIFRKGCVYLTFSLNYEQDYKLHCKT